MSHLLLFSVLATLAGATSYQKIIALIALQRERLNAVFGACFRRAPAVNTLRHLFLALGRDDLEAAFRRHACDLSTRSTPEMLRTVALDGKTLRGSFDHLTDRKAVHVLNAFASNAPSGALPTAMPSEPLAPPPWSWPTRSWPVRRTRS